jgi:hypothetical protein
MRLLQFTPDSKTLYFTTTLLNAVQSYSLREARLLDPGPTHTSAPTVLAISPTSHLLLTASEFPPAVYLQNLTLATQPLFLQPHASFSPVTCASFHPERSNIFLLAFKDGTLAAYNATQLMRPSDTTSGNNHAEGQEIASFKLLHHVATHIAHNPAGGLKQVSNEGTGLRSVGITGAAFLPGYRSRVVTVGADGKCKIVDFEKSQILRTWHVKGPATSLAILSPSQKRRGSKAVVPRKPTAMSGTTSTILCIGRIDGKVVFFDVFGVKLHDLLVDDAAGRVVDVEWVKGRGPKVLGNSAEVQFTSETWIELFTVGGTLRSRKSEISGEQSRISQTNTQESHKEHILPADKTSRTDGSTTTSPEVSPTASPGHLDDIEVERPMMNIFNTVKHNTIEGPVHRDLPPVSNNDYMDLFSPVKQSQPRLSPIRPSPPKRRTTPRSRPRLSSSTFVYQGTNIQSPPQPNFRALKRAPTKSDTVKSTNVTSKSSKESQTSPTKKRAVVPKSVFDSYCSPVLRGIQIPGSYSHGSSAIPASSSSANSANSKILADLRRFGEKGAASKGVPTGNRATLAPYMPSQPQKVSARRPSLGGRSAIKSKVPPVAAPAPMKNRKNEDTATEEDIWLTAESDVDDEPSNASFKTKTKHSPNNHRRKVSSQGTQIWDELEQGTNRKPQRVTTQKRSIETKLAPTRTKTRSTVSELNEKVEKTNFSKGYRSYDPSPSPNLPEFSSRMSTQRRLTNRRKIRSASTACEGEDRDETVMPSSLRGRLASAADLPPGFAHSFHGPVPVASYLPRKGSLAFVPSLVSSPEKSQSKGSSALGEVRGNELKWPSSSNMRHERKGSRVTCDGCEGLKCEVDRLREEVDRLKRVLKGKDLSIV